MNELLNYMESWYRESEESLKARGLKVFISPTSENAKPSRYIDIESNSKFGRLVVWASGEAEIQIENFNVATTESISTLTLRTREDVTQALSKLVKNIE